MPTGPRALTVGVVVSLLLGACAGREGSRRPAGPRGPDSDVATPLPAPSSPAPTPAPLLVTPRSGLVDVRPTVWEKAEIVNERTLLVQFWSGVEECYGVDRVDVDYRTQEVSVTVYEGRLPSAEVCIEIALLKAVRVSLEEPIAGRKIVDGAEAPIANARHGNRLLGTVA
jgi:hypothetical protein